VKKAPLSTAWAWRLGACGGFPLVCKTLAADQRSAPLARAARRLTLDRLLIR
jgi:hypothetical protein